VNLVRGWTKRDMNHWICYSDLNGFYPCIHIGSDSLGSPWQETIPITGALLAGLRSGKIKAEIVYDYMRLVGGVVIRLEKIDDLVPEDFDEYPITRNQFEIMVEGRQC